MTREPSDGSFGVLDRVTAILDVLSDEDGGIGVSEIAARAGMPKSTVSRLVSGLVRRGYLERDGAAVRLGLRLFELSELAAPPGELRRAALPVMSALRRATGCSVLLDVRDAHEAVCVAVVRAGAEAAALEARIGTRTPLAASASGRALLAGTTVAEYTDAAGAGFCVATPLTTPTGLSGAALSIMGASGDAGGREDALVAAARQVEQTLGTAH